MYQIVDPYQQNASPLQTHDPQSLSTEHFIQQQQMFYPQAISTEHYIQQQQSFPFVSSNVIPIQQADGNSMPPMYMFNSMMPLPAMTIAQPGSFNAGRVSAIPSDPYCCNFLVQLEGCYETDVERIQVEIVQGDQQYAKVRRQNTAEESVVHQLIYEDDTRFTLCSLSGYVLAVMVKGSIMKHSVTWYTNDGSQIVWRRNGDVTFTLVTLTPEQSRRNSVSSNISGVSQMSYSEVRPNETIADVHMRIRPELRTEEEISTGSSPTQGDTLKDSAASSNLSESSISQGTSIHKEQRLSDDELFDQFKNHCARCPSLRQKIIQWGISLTSNHPVGAKEISKLAAGRIWVKATLIHTHKRSIGNWQEVLDEVKGAYHEVEEGVYMQPASQPNEPGIQHRLRRTGRGFWIIEEPNENHDLWFPCVQELPSGNWVDVNDSRMRCNIQIIKMESVLYSMRDQWADLEEMERTMEFLFNSCNPKKLSTKLKARNLKHNINSLTLKLEKQYNLNFAIRVAEMADAIALEGDGRYVHAK